MDVLAKFSAMEPARIAKMHRISYATALDPRLIQPMIDACAKYKVIPAAFDAKDMICLLYTSCRNGRLTHECGDGRTPCDRVGAVSYTHLDVYKRQFPPRG